MGPSQDARQLCDVPIFEQATVEDGALFPLSPLPKHRQRRAQDGLDSASSQPAAANGASVMEAFHRQQGVSGQNASFMYPPRRRSQLCDTLPIFDMPSTHTASDVHDSSWLLQRDELDVSHPMASSSQLDSLYQFQLPTLRQLDEPDPTHDSAHAGLRSITLTTEALRHLNAVAGFAPPTAEAADSAARVNSASEPIAPAENRAAAWHSTHDVQHSTDTATKDATKLPDDQPLSGRRMRRNSSPANVYSQLLQAQLQAPNGAGKTPASAGSNLSGAPSCETPNSSQDCFMLLPLPPIESEAQFSRLRNAAAWDSLSRVLPDGSQLSRAVMLQHQDPAESEYAHSVKAVLGWLGGSSEEEALGLGATLHFGHVTPSEGSVMSMPLSSRRGPESEALLSYRAGRTHPASPAPAAAAAAAAASAASPAAAPSGSSLAPWALDVLFDDSDSEGEEGASSRPSPNRLTPTTSVKSGWLRSSMLQSTMSTQESLTKPMPIDGPLDPIPLPAAQQPTTLTAVSSIGTLLDLKQEFQRLSWLDMSNPVVDWLAPSPRSQTGLTMFSAIQMNVAMSPSRQPSAPASPASTIICPITVFSPGRRGRASVPTSHQPLQPSTPLNACFLNHQYPHIFQSMHHLNSRPSTPGSARVPPSPSASLITPRSTTKFIPSLPETPLSSARSWRRSRLPSLRDHSTGLPFPNTTTMSVPLNALHDLLQELHQVSHGPGSQYAYTPRQTPLATPLTTPRAGIWSAALGNSPLGGFPRFGAPLQQLPEGSTSASPESRSQSSLHSSPQQSTQLQALTADSDAGVMHKSADDKAGSTVEADGCVQAASDTPQDHGIKQHHAAMSRGPEPYDDVLNTNHTAGRLEPACSKDLSVEVGPVRVGLAGAAVGVAQQGKQVASPGMLLSPNLLTPERSVEDWSGPNMEHDSPLTMHTDSAGMESSIIAIVRTSSMKSAVTDADGVNGSVSGESEDLRFGVDATLTAFGLVRSPEGSKLTTGGSESGHEGRVQQLLSLHQKVLEARTLEEKQQFSRAIDQLLQQGLATATWVSPLMSPHSNAASTPKATPPNTSASTYSTTATSTDTTNTTHVQPKMEALTTPAAATPFMVPPDTQLAFITDSPSVHDQQPWQHARQAVLMDGRLPSMQPWPAYSARAPIDTCPEVEVRAPLQPQASAQEPHNASQLERSGSGKVGELADCTSRAVLDRQDGSGSVGADVFLPLKSPKEGPVMKPDVPKLNLLNVSSGSSATADRYHAMLSSRSTDTAGLSSFRSASSLYLSTYTGANTNSLAPDSPPAPPTTAYLPAILNQADRHVNDSTLLCDIKHSETDTEGMQHLSSTNPSSLIVHKPVKNPAGVDRGLTAPDSSRRISINQVSTHTNMDASATSDVAASPDEPEQHTQARLPDAGDAAGLSLRLPTDTNLDAVLSKSHASKELMHSTTADESATSTPTSIPSMHSSSAPMHSISSSLPDDAASHSVAHTNATVHSNPAGEYVMLGLNAHSVTSQTNPLISNPTTHGGAAAPDAKDLPPYGQDGLVPERPASSDAKDLPPYGQDGLVPERPASSDAKSHQQAAASGDSVAGPGSPMATSSPHLQPAAPPSADAESASETKQVLSMLMRKSTELEDLLSQVRRLKDEPQTLPSFNWTHNHTPPLPPSVLSLTSAATSAGATTSTTTTPVVRASAPATLSPSQDAVNSPASLPASTHTAVLTSSSASPAHARGRTLSCDVLPTPPPSGPPTPQHAPIKSVDVSFTPTVHVSALHNKATLRPITRTDTSSSSTRMTAAAKQALLTSTPTAGGSSGMFRDELPVGVTMTMGHETLAGLCDAVQPASSLGLSHQAPNRSKSLDRTTGQHNWDHPVSGFISTHQSRGVSTSRDEMTETNDDKQPTNSLDRSQQSPTAVSASQDKTTAANDDMHPSSSFTPSRQSPAVGHEKMAGVKGTHPSSFAPSRQSAAAVSTSRGKMTGMNDGIHPPSSCLPSHHPLAASSVKVTELDGDAHPSTSLAPSHQFPLDGSASHDSSLDNVALWLASESNCIGQAAPSDCAVSDIHSLDSEVFTKISWDGVSERGEALHAEAGQSEKKMPIARTAGQHATTSAPLTTVDMNRSSTSAATASEGRSRLQAMSERVAQLRARRLSLGQASVPGTPSAATPTAAATFSPQQPSHAPTPASTRSPSPLFRSSSFQPTSSTMLPPQHHVAPPSTSVNPSLPSMPGVSKPDPPSGPQPQSLRSSWPASLEHAAPPLPESRPPQRSVSSNAHVHLADFLTPSPDSTSSHTSKPPRTSSSGRILLKDFLM